VRACVIKNSVRLLRPPNPVCCVVHLVYAHRCGRYILRVYIFLLIPRTFCFAKHLQYKRAEAFFRAPALSLNFLLLLWLKLHEHTLTLGLFLRHPPTTTTIACTFIHTREPTHIVYTRSLGAYAPKLYL
jgi:hypothetical protein